MRFLAIDFETASARRDSACAVGVALVDGGRLVSSTAYLIRPPGNRYDTFNIGVHGITPAMTASAAAFLPVMNTVLELAEGLPLVAHNAAFDMSVLRAGFDSAGHPYPPRNYYCTLLMSRATLPGLPDYWLPSVLAAFGGTLRNHHNAQADAEACAEIALAIARTSGADTLGDLVRCVGMEAGELSECGYRPCRCSARPGR